VDIIQSGAVAFRVDGGYNGTNDGDKADRIALRIWAGRTMLDDADNAKE
jgi:hypothetical protein